MTRNDVRQLAEDITDSLLKAIIVFAPVTAMFLILYTILWWYDLLPLIQIKCSP